MSVIAPVTKLARFQGQWGGAYAESHCFMCKARLYHTAQEHEMAMSEGLRKEIAR